jgi:hypothetical protein
VLGHTVKEPRFEGTKKPTELATQRHRSDRRSSLSTALFRGGPRSYGPKPTPVNPLFDLFGKIFQKGLFRLFEHAQERGFGAFAERFLHLDAR